MLAGSDATTNALHPGMVDTNIVRSYPAWFQKAYGLIVPYIAKTVNQGAATQVYVATHPAVAGVNGAYFEDCNPVIVSGDSYLHDVDLAEKLWRVSVQMTRGFIS